MIALPPQAGRVIGVSEIRSGSTVTQTIALQADPTTPGQNQLVVTTRRTGLAERITSDAIAAEMAKAMPGVPMAIVNSLNRNASASFGYALGRAGDQTCLYGWQSVGGLGRHGVTTPLLSGPRRSLVAAASALPRQDLSGRARRRDAGARPLLWRPVRPPKVASARMHWRPRAVSTCPVPAPWASPCRPRHAGRR